MKTDGCSIIVLPKKARGKNGYKFVFHIPGLTYKLSLPEHPELPDILIPAMTKIQSTDRGVVLSWCEAVSKIVDLPKIDEIRSAVESDGALAMKEAEEVMKAMKKIMLAFDEKNSYLEALLAIAEEEGIIDPGESEALLDELSLFLTTK
jgi:hypothetical protein